MEEEHKIQEGQFMEIRGLAIDNGGSAIRTLTLDGYLMELPNDFVAVDDKAFRVKETEDKLGLCNVVHASNREYCGIIACGMTGRLYEGKRIAFDSQSAKTSSMDYYREFIYTLARDAIKEKRGEYGNVRERVQSSGDAALDFKYVLSTCIPIKEHSGRTDCAAKLKEALEGVYDVEFPLLPEGPNSVSFSISASNIGVLPEGGVAITALRGTIGKEDITLIVDMGHVTVDLALFKGTTLYGGQVVSSPYAGSTLIGLVRAALADEGFFLNEAQVQDVLETNRVRQGVTNLDITDLVNKQRSIFVQNYLKSEIVELLNMNAINAKQIQYFVPIGAGMNNAYAEGSIVREIVASCGLDNASVKLLSDDLRLVNVEQALVYAEAMYKRATK